MCTFYIRCDTVILSCPAPVLAYGQIKASPSIQAHNPSSNHIFTLNLSQPEWQLRLGYLASLFFVLKKTIRELMVSQDGTSHSLHRKFKRLYSIYKYSTQTQTPPPMPGICSQMHAFKSPYSSKNIIACSAQYTLPLMLLSSFSAFARSSNSLPASLPTSL